MLVALGSLISVSAQIANTVQESGVISTAGLSLCGIQFPAAFTGTAVTFEAATSAAGPFVPVYNAAGALSYTVAQGQYVAINPQDFQGISFLKIKSGSAEGALRTLVCSLKGI